MARCASLWSFLSFLFLAALALGCSARHNAAPQAEQLHFAQKIDVPSIPDFGKVNDFLYRGAQPKEGGVEQLRKFGIDTIVDLRGELRGLIENERQRGESLGMRFINLPGSGWAAPKDEEIAKFFSLVRERPKRKIFIHCWLGGDRSGMFIAAYRIAFDGWTAQQAIDEMRAFHYLEFWHPNMKRYVEEFPERLAHSPQLAPFRQTTNISGSTTVFQDSESNFETQGQLKHKEGRSELSWVRIQAEPRDEPASYSSLEAAATCFVAAPILGLRRNADIAASLVGTKYPTTIPIAPCRSGRPAALS